MENRIYTAIVVDDESNARLTLRALIEEYCPEIHLVGDFEKPQEAISFLLEHHVDIAFIDINMPKMTGFDFLASINRHGLKAIIVSAYDNYGIQAVKAGAFDYLLKPVAINELRQVVVKIQATELEKKVSKLPEEESFNFTIPLTNGIKVVDYREIVYLTSDNSYCDMVLANGKKFIVTKGIGDFESLLAEKGFFRVHNKHLINTHHVDTIKLEGLGSVQMNDGSDIPVSRRRMKDFKEEIQRKFGA